MNETRKAYYDTKTSWGPFSNTSDKPARLPYFYKIISKFRLLISWFLWPFTYLIMFVFSYLVNMRIYYEDVDFTAVKKPLILVSNHRGIFDPWHISFALPFKILFGRIFPLRPFAAVELSEKNSVGRLLKSLGIVNLVYFIYNTISISKEDTLDGKIFPFVSALKNNQSIMMFPEGRLVFDSSILDFKKGVVRIHQLTGAPILPVAVKYEKSSSPFRRVSVAIGKPFVISPDIVGTGDAEFYNARNLIREKVVSLYEKI